MHQAEIVLGLPLPANQQRTEPIVPAIGSLHDPATCFASPARSGLFTTTPNVRHDASPFEPSVYIRIVIALVQATVDRTPPLRARRVASSTVVSAIRISGTFAPLMTMPSGIPAASVRMCLFVPLFARSVGFGPVRSPPWGLSRSPSRERSTSSQCRRGRRSMRAGGCRASPESPVEPIRYSVDGRSSPNRSWQVWPSTGSPCGADK
jgi:hypothetical protein